MEHDSTKQLHVVMHHFPFEVVTACGPVVMVDGFIAIYGDEVFLRVCGQFAVKVGSGYDSFLVFGETACGFFHDAESGIHYLIKRFLIDVKRFFFQFVYLIENGLALIDGRILYGGFQFCYLLLLFFRGVLHVTLYFLGLGAQFIIGENFDVLVFSFDFLHDRLYKLHVT